MDFETRRSQSVASRESRRFIRKIISDLRERERASLFYAN